MRGLGSFAPILVPALRHPRSPALAGALACGAAGSRGATRGPDGQVALLVCVSPDDGAVQLYAAEGAARRATPPSMPGWRAGPRRGRRCLAVVEALRLGEHARLLAAWNATQQPYRDDACIHELFAEQVQRTPTRSRVVFAGSSLTYGELHARANRLAHHLRMLGVQPEVRVGICLERSLDLVVAIFAVLGAGGAYVPLDPSYPEARLRLMAEDAQVRVLLTDSRCASTGLRPRYGSISISSASGWRCWCDDAPASLARPDDLAYVIYTWPRPVHLGVAVAHRGVVNLCSTRSSAWACSPAPRCAVFADRL